MKHILITNDDGYEAKGLLKLASALQKIAKVTVVAPKNEKSACGHSITLTSPLKLEKIKDGFYRVDDGTPTDCVFLATNALLADSKPDLIISGINHGANMGEDITYSGTASGAMEGVLRGVPSISISQVYNKQNKNKELDFYLATKTIVEVVSYIFADKFPLPARKFLNINIPPISIEDCKGYQITKCGVRFYGDDLKSYKDPRGNDFYWLGTHPLAWEKKSDRVMTDFDAIDNGFVSITPITLDMTSKDDIDDLANWIEKQ
jgi:5'-nucleotidase